MTTIQLWYRNHRNAVTIFQYSLLSVLLLVVTWLVDYQFPAVKLQIPEVLLLSTQVSVTFLSNLSGVFLTVTTFTFSTILTVVNQHASSLTPRVVQDFIEKPNVLSLFGILIGGFFYTVLSLLMLQNVVAETKMLSGTIGVSYAILAMSSFVLFARQVLRDVKVNRVVDDLFDKAWSLVEEEAEARCQSKGEWEEEQALSWPIYASTTGYLYAIDTDNLDRLLTDYSGELVIKKRIGDSVSKGMWIADLRLRDWQEDIQLPPALLEAIGKAVVVNRLVNDNRDYHHELTNLVEIALRALSPGINDPNTAILCISQLSRLLGRLFSSRNHMIIHPIGDNFRVVYASYSVAEELYLTFSQLMLYGKQDPRVAYALLEGLCTIYGMADKSVKSAVSTFFEETYTILLSAMETEMDRRYVSTMYQVFQRLCSR